MKKRIVIHATNRPADMSVTLNDIEDMNSQDMKSDPMPYHYIVNIDGRTMKGKRDKELCGHCGKFSRDSISVAYAGGIDAEGEAANTLNETQETALRFMVGQLMKGIRRRKWLERYRSETEHALSHRDDKEDYPHETL